MKKLRIMIKFIVNRMFCIVNRMFYDEILIDKKEIIIKDDIIYYLVRSNYGNKYIGKSVDIGSVENEILLFKKNDLKKQNKILNKMLNVDSDTNYYVIYRMQINKCIFDYIIIEYCIKNEVRINYYKKHKNIEYAIENYIYKNESINEMILINNKLIDLL